jgi:hypothetical protein
MQFKLTMLAAPLSYHLWRTWRPCTLTGLYGLLAKEVAKLPELPPFVKVMYANGNGGEPGKE